MKQKRMVLFGSFFCSDDSTGMPTPLFVVVQDLYRRSHFNVTISAADPDQSSASAGAFKESRVPDWSSRAKTLLNNILLYCESFRACVSCVFFAL